MNDFEYLLWLGSIDGEAALAAYRADGTLPKWTSTERGRAWLRNDQEELQRINDRKLAEMERRFDELRATLKEMT